MADLEFDRGAVGIVANGNWKDAEEFGRISGTLNTLSMGPAAQPLPDGDNSGTSALASSPALSTLRTVLAEYGDAAAILGSGTEETIKDFDSTENAVLEGFAKLDTQRLGGGKMKAMPV